MRILMLTQFYLPIIGGEEQHVRNLSQNLVARGHQVAIATLHQPGLPETEMDKGVRIYRLRSTAQRATWLFSEAERTHAAPLPDPELVMGLKSVLDREKPEVVHAHNWILHSFLPLEALHRLPFVVTLHDYSLACATKRFMYAGAPCSGPGLVKCLRCSARHYGAAKGAVTTVANWSMGALESGLVDVFLAVSEATAVGNGLKARGLPYRVIPNFIPLRAGAPTEPFDSGLIAQLPERYILFVGDLSHDKGVDVILTAYARLASPPPLVMIGRPGPDTPSQLPDNVLMFSKWPHASVMEAWRRSLFGLAPSTWGEPCGTVVLEAMAAGRAVIASDIGGMPDMVVNGQTGLLVVANDAGSLQQAMQRLLADTAWMARLGEAGHQRVSDFSADSVVPQIESVYRELIAGHQQRAGARAALDRSIAEPGQPGDV